MHSVTLDGSGSPRKRTFSRGISEDESLRSLIKEVSAEMTASLVNVYRANEKASVRFVLHLRIGFYNENVIEFVDVKFSLFC